MEKDLVNSILERLHARRQRSIEQQASIAIQEDARVHESLALETKLAEVGLEVREAILYHRQNNRKWLARWLGGPTVAIAYGQDPDFKAIFQRLKETRRLPGKVYNLARRNITQDFQSTISSPLFLTETGELVDEHRFQYGWRCTLKTGSHAPGEPKYGFSKSPLYIYRVAQEIYTGEEEAELQYVMFFDGCMDGHRGNKLKSYTGGVEDDEISIVGKDAHNHTLGIMQAALRELWPGR